MGLTEVVRRIVANYQSDNPGVQGKLAQILLQGRLGGTGKMIVLPVDQGIEHGPARSEAARRFGIHRSTVRKMLTFSRTAWLPAHQAALASEARGVHFPRAAAGPSPLIEAPSSPMACLPKTSSSA